MYIYMRAIDEVIVHTDDWLTASLILIITDAMNMNRISHSDLQQLREMRRRKRRRRRRRSKRRRRRERGDSITLKITGSHTHTRGT